MKIPLYLVIALGCVLPWFMPIDYDQEYIFGKAQLIAGGLEPYRDFQCYYSPGIYWVWGIIFSIFGYSWEITRIFGSLIILLFYLSVYRALPENIRIPATLCIALFMTEFPANTIINCYTFIIPAVILLIRTARVPIDTACLIGYIACFRYDTSLLILGAVIFVMACERRLKDIGCTLLWLLPIYAIIVYAMTWQGFMDNMALSRDVINTQSECRISITKAAHFIRYFPVFAPVLMILLSISTYIRTKKTELLAGLAFTAVLYIPGIWCVDLCHVAPSVICAIVSGCLIFERRKHPFMMCGMVYP